MRNLHYITVHLFEIIIKPAQKFVNFITIKSMHNMRM